MDQSIRITEPLPLEVPNEMKPYYSSNTNTYNIFIKKYPQKTVVLHNLTSFILGLLPSTQVLPLVVTNVNWRARNTVQMTHSDVTAPLVVHPTVIRLALPGVDHCYYSIMCSDPL